MGLRGSMNNGAPKINDRCALTQKGSAPVNCPASFWLRLVMPTMKVMINRSAENGIGELALVQSSDNPLITARRECLMVIGTGKDNQTVTLFKVSEFQRKVGLVVDLAALNVNNSNESVPVHRSRKQMTPGYKEKIRIGERTMMRKINATLSN